MMDRYQGSLWDIVGEEGANIPDRRAVAADLVKQLTAIRAFKLQQMERGELGWNVA